MVVMDISVIIPIYNVEDYLLECLQSVAKQSKTDGIECILVDDKGDDNSMEIAEKFIASYDGNIEFRVLHHDKNKGLSAARNTGIRNARGKYLYFLDSDDAIMGDCMEILFGLAENYKADLVQGAYKSEAIYLLQMDKSILPLFSEDGSYIKRTLLNYDVVPVMAQNRLVKTAVVRNHELYFKEGIIHEDQYWTFFLAKYIEKVVFCKNKTYFYRQNPNSITGHINIGKEIVSFKTIIEDFCANIDSFEQKAQKKYVFCTLLRAIDSHFYASYEEKRYLLNLYKEKLTFFERILFSGIFIISPKTKRRTLLLKLYLKFLNI